MDLGQIRLIIRKLTLCSFGRIKFSDCGSVFSHSYFAEGGSN